MVSASSSDAQVNVIVTCYNQAGIIIEALNSVAVQTEQRFKLIVTDDGSTDDSVDRIGEWLRAYRGDALLVANPTNVGLPATLNRTLAHLTCRYTVVLNGDDTMAPDRLERQLDLFDSLPPEVGIVYSQIRMVDAAGIPTGDRYPKTADPPQGDILNELVEGIDLGMPALMVRTAVFDVIGPWDESLIADDYDLILRVARAGFQFVYLPICAVNYRVTESSMTRSRHAALIVDRVKALEKLIGVTDDLDRRINARVEDLISALPMAGGHAPERRSLAWRQLRRRPTKRAARILVEAVTGWDLRRRANK
jgi:GT2 family glycosyltransferase